MTEDRFKEIQQMPEVRDSIILKLEHIRRYLRQDKASVMVGAGFSKNAKMSPSVNVKDWNALTDEFINRIYSAEEQKELKIKYVSPLRIAAQIEACYGRHELEDIIKTAIPDESLSPGELHEQLVELNWRDIFTMNYDTLIERAASSKGIRYELVTTKETLYYQSTRRIIKLHGSHPNARPYIITEEDYRKYAQDYPEFVNTVRQALLESVFCLIGFSGEDPNFLEWLGWVRDIMGKRMSPVYMISVQDTHINEAELALLKSRGISIISRPKGISVKEFFEFIFKFLAIKPSRDKWEMRLGKSIVPDTYYHFNTLEEQKKTVRFLKKHRESYPGWLIVREDRLDKYDFVSPSRELDSIEEGYNKIEDKNLKLELLFEADWRFRMNFSPAYMYSWYIEAIKKVIDEDYTDKERSFIFTSSLSVSLLSLHRQRFEIEEAHLVEKQIQEYENKLGLEDLNRFRYEQCLLRIPILNYDEVFKILDTWTPTSEDYRGVIWKSAILTEVGEIEQAISMLINSRQQAQKAMLSKEHPNVEESAVEIINCILNSFPRNQRIQYNMEDAKESPFNYYKYINSFSSSVRKEIQDNDFRDSKIHRIHNFNLEHITNKFSIDNNRTIEKEQWFASSMLLFWETYGYPFGFIEYNINPEGLRLSLHSALTQNQFPFGMHHLIRSANTELITKELTREKVFELSRNFIKSFSNLLLKSWEEKYARQDIKSYREWRFKRAVIVILSRLAIFNGQEEIQRTINVLLSLNENDSPAFEMEYLRCSLNSQTLENLSRSIEACLECKLIDNRKHYPFQVPVYRYLDYTASDKAYSIVLNGLESKDDEISELAYIRCARHYAAFTQKNSDEINQGVVIWRNRNIGKITNALYSFNLVPHGSTTIEEVYSIDSLTNESIKKYHESEALNPNSIEQPAFYEFLETIIPLGKYMSELQVKDTLDIILDFIKCKEQAFKEESKKREQMFWKSDLRKNFESIIKAILSCKYFPDYKDKYIEIQNVLISYGKSNFPIAIVLKYLNGKTKYWNSTPIKKLIREGLDSSDSDVQEDAVECLSTSFDFVTKNIWKSLINSMQYMRAENLAKYVTSLSDLCLSQNLHFYDLNIRYALDGVWRNLEKTFNWSGDEYDIQYRIMKILGFYSHLKDNQFNALAGRWKEDINHPDTPNDVKRGYEEGKAAYERIRKKQEES